MGCMGPGRQCVWNASPARDFTTSGRKIQRDKGVQVIRIRPSHVGELRFFVLPPHPSGSDEVRMSSLRLSLRMASRFRRCQRPGSLCERWTPPSFPQILGPSPFDKLKAFPVRNTSGREPAERLADGPSRDRRAKNGGCPSLQNGSSGTPGIAATAVSLLHAKSATACRQAAALQDKPARKVHPLISAGEGSRSDSPWTGR